MEDSRSPESTSLDAMAQLQQIIVALRIHCPWTAQLTHQALIPYLVEEAEEVAEEIEAGADSDPQRSEDFRKELGDMLLQVVLHAALAEERGDFDLNGVAEAISAKLIRRNPHVFAADGTLNPREATVEEVDATWQRIKSEEKAAVTTDGAHGDDT